MRVSFWIMVFSGYMSSSGIAESYGSSTFRFLRKLHTVLHHGYINLHSHQQFKLVPFSSPPSLSLFEAFMMMVILIHLKWYITVVLICISLIISDAEHHFMSFLAICMSSLVKCLFKSYAHFLSGLFVFLFFGIEQHELFVYFVD